MWQTFGHLANKELLEKHLASGKFPHAYLFAGPRGLGKSLLAGEFAAKLLKADNLSAHPDFTKLSLSGELGVETARDFFSQLKVKPFLGQWKVALLDNAENLTPPAANALLKTLEEPSPSTILILIAAKLNLPKTIVSRCQVFSFHRLSQSQLEKYAESLGLLPDAETFALSFGAPGRLNQFLADAEQLRQLKQALQKLDALVLAHSGERLLAVNEFAEMPNPELAELLTSWLYRQVNLLGQKPLLYRTARAIFSACQGLRLNLNKKLVLQSLFLSLA